MNIKNEFVKAGFKYAGYDNNNILRVFGRTEKECQKAKEEYINEKSKLWAYREYPNKTININIRKIEG